MLIAWLLSCIAAPEAPPAEPPATELAPAPPVAQSAVAPVAPRPAALQERLDAAAAETPRTRHLRPDGAPRYTNRLALSDSPYLRQHAHNPVDWFEWGSEAFELAERLGRPVLLSVGYATCHWCHVMEEESFEDPGIAAYLNAHYVPIKVDREQLPHVDRTYMAAVHAMGVRGGWPMTVWLTPDRAPFYATTYLPPRDGDRGRPRGFLTALQQLHTVWSDEQGRLRQVSAELVHSVRQQLQPLAPGGVLPIEVLHRQTDEALDRYDPVHGGAEGAPSFPSDLPLRWLLLPTEGPRATEARAAAVHTLRAMADGGLRDVLAGGFHRYSVDQGWGVPHFEKMLYDNALLADTYLRAWQQTGDEELLQTARTTLRFIDRSLSTPAGGFASALDADSLDPESGERLEGRFYTWTADEIVDAVGSAAPQTLAALGVDPDASGAIEGRHVLRRADTEAFDDPVVRAARVHLRTERQRRPPPATDPKEVVAWNGLAISAFARAGRVLQAPAYLERARAAAEHLWADAVQVEGTGSQTRARVRRLPTVDAPLGELDDHAWLAAGFVDLFEAGGDPRWLRRALAIDRGLQEYFAAPGGGWYATADDADELLVRAMPRRDGPYPSGASVHPYTLLRLAALTGDDRYRQRAHEALGAYAEPLAAGRMPEGLRAVHATHDRFAQIVVVVPSLRGQAAPLLDVLARHAPPHHVQLVLPASEVESVAAVAPMVADKVARDGEPTAYLCEQGVCQSPVTDPEALRRQLAAW